MKSIFEETCDLPNFESLKSDARADVLVIGGGIAGILAARLLADAGADVSLLEADRLCSGQTGRTTAKITVQHGFCYADILKRYGREGAATYLAANEEALDRYRAMAQEIPCDFEERDFYVYEKRDARILEREISALSAIGANVQSLMPYELPFPTVGALCVKRQAQFHPLRFLCGCLGGIRIYENTPVTALFEGGALTAAGHRVRAEHTVVATHFPFLRVRGGYAFKMYQSRSYVLGLKNVKLPQGMYADGAGKGISLRSFKDVLLLGGGTHRTGTAGGGYHVLEGLAESYYPGAEIVSRYAAQDCMTLDGMPYIGRYAASMSRVYVTTGFLKWGMSGAMVSAKVLADLIQGKQTPSAALFAPNRPMPPLRFLRETGAVLRHYIRPTAPRCPHLGCALRYNRQERSWDCPCHGSRFTALGHVIDDPALHDLKSLPRVKK